MAIENWKVVKTEIIDSAETERRLVGDMHPDCVSFWCGGCSKKLPRAEIGGVITFKREVFPGSGFLPERILLCRRCGSDKTTVQAVMEAAP